MKLKNLILGLVCLVLMTSIASAATYYVAPDGNDSDPGTEAEPWATIGTHLFGGDHTNILSSDTIFIKNGTYTENETALHGIYTTRDFTLIGEDRDSVKIIMADYSGTSEDNY